ncbi:MAG: DUF721 domain-containing protein [Candidatus Rokubacteria bacterium]|nr:DUF721 domain-containing protein [Candidatus Rokubacteria bacterium]
MGEPTRVSVLLAGLGPPLAERVRHARLAAEWATLVGPAVARHAAPLHLEDGWLHVAVDSSAWLHELSLKEEELLAVLRRVADLRGVRLRLAPLPAHRPEPRAPARRRHLLPEEQAAIEEALAPIRDPALAATVRRVMTKDRLTKPSEGAPPA